MAAKMFLNLCGNLKMPVVGFGTGMIRDPTEMETALNKALEVGYRHIDTAYAYGNETLIGRVLKEWFDSGKLKRDDVFITTKLPAQGVHPDRVEYFMKKSLENLQLDYVDLYLIHTPFGTKCDISTGKIKMNDKNEFEVEGKTDHAAIWKKVEEQVDAGRTKAIGLSNYNISQIETVLKTARIKPAILQVELHVFLQQRELVDFCHKNDIAVVAYSPLGSPGHNILLRSRGMPEKKLPDIIGNDIIKKIAEKHSKTPAQVALRFLIQRGLAPIPKSVTPKRIQENIDIFYFELDETDFKELSDLEMGEAGRVCTFDNKAFQGHPDYPFKR